MRVVMLGVNHVTAPVEVREKLALSGVKLGDAIDGFRARYPAVELVIVSTCNRTELYFARPTHEEPSVEAAAGFLAGLGGMEERALRSCLIQRENQEAIGHLFRVAIGLESMVLGEPQILGQVKRAYEEAVGMGVVGPVLHRVFQGAVAAAKQVRTETGIGDGNVSIGSVAVDFARQIFERFDDKVVVGIGAGEAAKLTLRHLKSLRPARLWVTNRSLGRAESLAAEIGLGGDGSGLGGGVRPFEELDQLLVEADIVLTSTSAARPIITVERFKKLLKKRKYRPVYVVDIAMPRDVEPAVGSLTNVYLYNIDDLQKVAASNHEGRMKLAERCEEALQEKVRACHTRVQNQDVGRLIRALRERLGQLGNVERERTLRRIQSVGAGELEAMLPGLLEEHTHRLINKILHLPLSQLDRRDGDGKPGFYAAALRQLFALETAWEEEIGVVESEAGDDKGGVNGEKKNRRGKSAGPVVVKVDGSGVTGGKK